TSMQFKNVNYFFLILLHTPRSTLFPYTTLFRSLHNLFAEGLFWRSLSRHDDVGADPNLAMPEDGIRHVDDLGIDRRTGRHGRDRSEEHTSELQSRENLVCRLLLEKKKKKQQHTY